jgi:hypothetical protein
MLQQIDIHVPDEPPVRPAAGEPGLFSGRSPQGGRVRSLLEAAARAARELESGSFDRYSYLQLRVTLDAVAKDEPDRTLPACEAIAQVLCGRDRRRSRETHLGGVAGFSLFNDPARLRSVSVNVDQGRGVGYDVLLAEMRTGATMVSVSDVERPMAPSFRRRGPITEPEDVAAFVHSLRAFLSSEVMLGGVIRVTPNGSVIRLQETYQGPWVEYGPFENFGRHPVGDTFEVNLSQGDLYPAFDFMGSNPVEWWWPLKIWVEDPFQAGSVGFYTSSSVGPQGSRCVPILAFYRPELRVTAGHGAERVE